MLDSVPPACSAKATICSIMLCVGPGQHTAPFSFGSNRSSILVIGIGAVSVRYPKYMPPTARGTALMAPLASRMMIFSGMSARFGTSAGAIVSSQSSLTMLLKEPSQPAT